MLIPALLSGAVCFAAYTLEAITGFGGAVLAMPFVSSLLGMRQGIMAITSLGGMLALFIAVTNRKFINWPQFARMCGAMLVGLPVGMYFFRKFDVHFLKRFLAIFIVSAALWHLFRKLFAKKSGASGGPEKGWKAVPYFLVLAAAGVVHGMLSSGGPLVVIYASKALPEKGPFRATLSLLWASLNTVIVATYLIERSFTPEIAGTIGIVSPFVALGIALGNKIHHKLNERFFSILVFLALFAAGCVIFFLP